MSPPPPPPAARRPSPHTPNSVRNANRAPAPGVLSRIGRRSALRVRVNPIDCVGHGLCAELFPEWITLDDWGYPIIDPRPVPPDLERHAKRAADACPTIALLLERVPRP